MYVSISHFNIMLFGEEGSVGWGENFLALSFSFPESDDTWSIEKKKEYGDRAKAKKRKFSLCDEFFYNSHITLIYGC